MVTGLVVVGVTSLAWMACAGVPSVPDLAAATAGLGPYRAERRLAVSGGVDDAVKGLYGSLRGARREVVKAVALPDGAGRLELARFRGEGPPVQFAFGQDTPDFGFLLDLDGDNFHDEGVTAWLYDRNHDGLVDDAECLGPFGSRAVERQGDDLVLRLALGEKPVSVKDAEVLGGPTRVLQHVQAAMP
jgi:hypothetical protein